MSARTTQTPAVSRSKQTYGSMARFSAVCAIAAACVAVVVSALAFVPLLQPEWRVPGWHWIAFSLTVVAAGVFALPVHAAAVRRLSRGLMTFQVGVSVTVIVLLVWSVLASDGPSTEGSVGGQFGQRVTAAALIVALGTVTDAFRKRVPGGWRDNGWATPLVFGVALATGLVWTLVSDVGAGWHTAVCVLAAAVPTTAALAHDSALIFGRNHAREVGIDVSAIDDIRTAAAIGAVVVDAHGTVTTGELTVLDTHPYDDGHKRNLSWFAGALEYQCTNRIGRALGRSSGQGRVTGFQYVEGRGALGSVDRHPVRVGSVDWIGICDPATEGTVLAVEVDGNPLGYLVLDEEVRSHAAKSLQRLSEMGVKPVLVSMGSEAETGRLADRSGADRWHSNMTADDVARLLAELRAEHGGVGIASTRERYGDVFEAADLVVTDRSGSARDGHLDDLDVRHVADTVEWCRQMVRQLAAGQRLAVVWMVIAACIAGSGAVAVAPAASLGVLGAVLVTLRSARVPASLPQRRSTTNG